MIQGEYSATLLTCIKLPFVIKIFVLSILSGLFTQVLLYAQYLSAGADPEGGGGGGGGGGAGGLDAPPEK